MFSPIAVAGDSELYPVDVTGQRRSYLVYLSAGASHTRHRREPRNLEVRFKLFVTAPVLL